MEGETPERIALGAIFAVAGNAVTQVGHVHTNLVFAAGGQLQFDERIAAVGGQDFITGQGILAVFLVVGRIDLECGILFEIGGHLPFDGCKLALDDGDIAAVEHHIVPRTLHFLLYTLTLGKHHQSRGIPVETMQNKDAVGGIVLTHIVAEYVIGGVGLDPVGRDRQKPIALVYDDEEFVFIDNAQTGVTELLVTPCVIDGKLIADMQRGIELGRRGMVHGYLAMRQIGFSSRP